MTSEGRVSSPRDVLVWLLGQRIACLDGWGLRTTPEVCEGTLLLDGQRWTVTITPAGGTDV